LDNDSANIDAADDGAFVCTIRLRLLGGTVVADDVLKDVQRLLGIYACKTALAHFFAF
jgi:hypothetical protein